jgi:2-oxoglutarate ferredoxin oxidoreductase subunit beta
MEWGEKIPIGLIYRNNRVAFERRVAVLEDGPLFGRDTDLRELGEILDKFS